MDSPGLSTYFFSVLLLICSAFFSATETAFSSVNMIRLRTLADDGDQKARRAVKIAEQWSLLLTTVLIGNNLVNIALSSIITVMATHWFGSYAVAAATGISTLVVLTFGEITPKNMARNNAEKWVLSVCGIMQVIITVLAPLSWFFLKLEKLTSKQPPESERTPTMTEKEFLYMLDTIEEEGVMEQREKELVESAVQFYDSTAEEIITPRVNVVALDVEDGKKEILEILGKERFSRIPVYEDTIDNIIGVVQARDVLETVLDGREINLRSLMSEPVYIHRTMKISKLLSYFQKEKTHMAVVLDDYGGTLGIVTMEDLLEELVGEIWDEDEEIVREYELLPDGSYDVSGDMEAEDFFEHIHYTPPETSDDWNTMNGWAMEQLEHIPQVGECFTCGPLAVTVREMDEQCIRKMNIRLLPLDEPQED